MIIEVTRELCQELRITRLNPVAVMWIEKTGLVRVPPDFVNVLLNNVRLSKSAQGKLDRNEWKAIFASALIYYHKDLGRKAAHSMLTTILPAILLLAVYILIVDRVLNLLSSRGLLSTLVFLPGFASVYFGMWRWWKSYKELWFDADRKTAQLVGREPLLQALRKLEAVSSKPTGRGYRMTVPKVSQRIARLEMVPG
jgi:Zn-dependent protease with chaperone function